MEKKKREERWGQRVDTVLLYRMFRVSSRRCPLSKDLKEVREQIRCTLRKELLVAPCVWSRVSKEERGDGADPVGPCGPGGGLGLLPRGGGSLEGCGQRRTGAWLTCSRAHPDGCGGEDRQYVTRTGAWNPREGNRACPDGWCWGLDQVESMTILWVEQCRGPCRPWKGTVRAGAWMPG